MHRCGFVVLFIGLMLLVPHANSALQTIRSNTTTYWISNATGDYSYALQSCIDLNATLAMLPDINEYSFLINWLKINTVEGNRPSFYLNARRETFSNTYQWGDGSVFPGAARWGPNQPSDRKGISNEDCISLRFEIDKFFAFDDLCSMLNYSYICQKRIEYSWGDWESWSSCSTSCKTGTRIRTRDCERVGTTGENTCRPSNESIQTEACNVHLCNETVSMTEACNATCNEVGVIKLNRVCKFNQIFPEQCQIILFAPCQKNCSGESNSIFNGITIRGGLPNRSTDTFRGGNTVVNATTTSSSVPISQETTDATLHATRAGTTQAPAKVETTFPSTTESTTEEVTTAERFYINKETLIAVCGGIAFFIFLVFVFYFIFTRKTKKKDSVRNIQGLQELPSVSSDHLYASASFHRIRSTRSNIYCDTAPTNQQGLANQSTNQQRPADQPTNQKDDLEKQPQNCQEEMEGTYVTLNYVTTNGMQTERKAEEIKIPSEKQSVCSEYISFEALESGCSFTQYSPQNYISSDLASQASNASRRSELKTLEFDYVSVNSLKRDEDKYGRLETSPTESRQWCETYDVMIR